jgi:hypothetical protein
MRKDSLAPFGFAFRSPAANLGARQRASGGKIDGGREFREPAFEAEGETQAESGHGSSLAGIQPRTRGRSGGET